MNSDGSNYPCKGMFYFQLRVYLCLLILLSKGYATAALINPLKPVATLTSGSPFTITLDGSASKSKFSFLNLLSSLLLQVSIEGIKELEIVIRFQKY